MAIEGSIHNNSMMEREAAHIMIVAHAGTLYQSLAHTLQEQLRGCQALICEAGATIADSQGDVRLILVDAGCGTGIAREIEARRALYPAAAIAILVDDPETLTSHCRELFAARKVQGILPLTLKLEVWLAAVLLLLSGGEYYPVANRREALPAVVPPPAPSLAPASAAAPAPVSPPAQLPRPPVAATPVLSSLTQREQEILELLSEGHQNKLIAHKMSLSEHTVKVHVHNLLSKLRVSNRTQAAATYRRGIAGPSGMAAQTF
jgi:DNA-binding NarL/FixJ family response regulator